MVFEHFFEDSPTVYIVDDEPLVRVSLIDLFDSLKLKAVGYESADEFLSEADLRQHGCILLDVFMPGTNGLDLQSQLALAGNTMPIVFMTGRGTVPMSVQAMKAGATDFLLKPFENGAVIAATFAAIRRDAERRQFVAACEQIRQAAASLTPREREVMKYVGDGLMNKQIAYEMKISEMMVKLHRGRMMRKMQAGSLAELVKKLDLVATEFDIYQ
ncbi:response regulator [Rhizobiaceae bacterium n13]|uniref:Response regulator n=1 Tax=Ferirhizobium litorale TaxID=2927786 RepID=A0AAE3QDN9_9HYPH|nr:response regulator [Fererhizobium litorale]MDI7861593.1 response regulator [Fererhizobium litorale]MDI7922065.1 response regulator [Fererhizobium litorale]